MFRLYHGVKHEPAKVRNGTWDLIFNAKKRDCPRQTSLAQGQTAARIRQPLWKTAHPNSACRQEQLTLDHGIGRNLMLQVMLSTEVHQSSRCQDCLQTRCVNEILFQPIRSRMRHTSSKRPVPASAPYRRSLCNQGSCKIILLAGNSAPEARMKGQALLIFLLALGRHIRPDIDRATEVHHLQQGYLSYQQVNRKARGDWRTTAPEVRTCNLLEPPTSNTGYTLHIPVLILKTSSRA